MTKRMTRRELLRVGGLGSMVAFLAACQPQAVEKIVKETVVVEKVVTQVIKEVVKETVIVEGKPKEVTKVVEKVVTTTPAPQMEAELEVWAYPETENDAVIVWEPLIIKFNEMYPKIKVNMDIQPWGGRREKLYAACAAGEPPDMWRGTNDTTPTYVQKDIIVDLTDMVMPEDLADYSESEIASGSYEGKLYLLMTTQQIMGYAYNVEMMQELGYDVEQDPIVTWDDLLTLGGKAKAKGYYAETVDTYSWPQWIRCIHQAGGTTYSADKTKSLMTEQPAIDLLTRYVTEFENEYCPLEGAVSTPEAANVLPNYWLQNMQATMHTQIAGECAQHAANPPGFSFLMASPRQRSKSDPLTSGNNSGDGLCITKLSKQKEAALAFGKFTIRPENIGLFCTLQGTSPLGTLSQKYWKAADCSKAWAAQNAQYQFTNQDSQTLWQESKVICAPHFQAAVLGKETVEEALQAIDKDLNAKLKEVYGG